MQDGAEDFGAEAAAAVAAAVARACEAERKVAELGDTVKELRDEISEEYQQRIKDSREAAKAQEALRHELAEAR